ncbi:hypothetical protein RB195_026007 [Necator americanus]|uniref:Uncharacterized protein n=1 Tax=Necator americanus TaxID=51031 RepID=A0ABR1EV38_NECAM
MKRCSPELNTAKRVAVGEETLSTWRYNFKTLPNLQASSAPKLEDVHGPTYVVKEESRPDWRFYSAATRWKMENLAETIELAQKYWNIFLRLGFVRWRKLSLQYGSTKDTLLVGTR